MNKILRLILPLIIILVTINISAQNNIDSLQKVLSKAKTDTEKIPLLLDLSWQLKSENGKTAMNYAQQALELAKTANDTKSEATALKTIGVIYLFKGNYDKSEQYHKDALALFSAVNDSKGISGCYNNLGIIHELKGEFVKAADQYQNSLKINQEINNSQGIASCYINLGNIFQLRGNYRRSIKYYFEALKIVEKINDKEGSADVYNNIGALNEKLLETDKALKNYQKALILYTEINNKDKISNVLHNIGQVLSSAKEYTKALNYYLQALEIRKQYGSKKGVAATTLDIGRIYLILNKLKKAEKYINESLKIFTEIDRKPGIVDALNALSEYYRKIKKYNKAIENLQKAVEIAKKIDYKPSLQENYELISKIYADQNKFNQAYKYRLLYEQIKDSLTGDQNNNNIIELQMQYEFEKSMKEHELQSKIEQIQTAEALKKQKIISYSLITGLILIALIALIAYLAYKRKKSNNKILQQQKEEIKAKNEELKIYQEKLISQKEYLAKQKQLIEENLDKISRQNQKITNSIQYALRIQNALLPSDEEFKKAFSDYFILNMPKDIVSGDFYWLKHTGNKVYIAVADSTGHGVPGAFMSLIGISFLNEIIKSKENLKASDILNQLRTHIKTALTQKNKQSKTGDGMDIALCILDKEKNKLQYAGAYNQLIIIKNKKELIEIKADKMPIGKHLKEKKSFTNHEIKFELNDRFYLFSDGYIHQFGGIRGKKFLLNNFKELLLKICNLPMEKQKQKLIHNFNNWKEDFDQVDDILIIGFKP